MRHPSGPSLSLLQGITRQTQVYGHRLETEGSLWSLHSKRLGPHAQVYGQDEAQTRQRMNPENEQGASQEGEQDGGREGSSAQETLQQQHPISLGSHQIWGPGYPEVPPPARKHLAPPVQIKAPQFGRAKKNLQELILSTGQRLGPIP